MRYLRSTTAEDGYRCRSIPARWWRQTAPCQRSNGYLGPVTLCKLSWAWKEDSLPFWTQTMASSTSRPFPPIPTPPLRPFCLSVTLQPPPTPPPTTTTSLLVVDHRSHSLKKTCFWRLSQIQSEGKATLTDIRVQYERRVLHCYLDASVSVSPRFPQIYWRWVTYRNARPNWHFGHLMPSDGTLEQQSQGIMHRSPGVTLTLTHGLLWRPPTHTQKGVGSGRGGVNKE